MDTTSEDQLFMTRNFGNLIFQLSTLLSNEFEANIQKLEGYF